MRRMEKKEKKSRITTMERRDVFKQTPVQTEFGFGPKQTE